MGFTATIDQSMSLGTVEETITVSGQSPLVDVTNPATSVDLASDALELLPTTRDGLKAFMAQVPGMRTNLDVGASSMTDTIVIRAYGQQGAPWQMLEGIMFASSGGNGVQGAHVDFNSIESTRLQTVGSSAEMPRRGPFIDSIVKSGGNQFNGEFVAYGSSDALEGENVDDELARRACGTCRSCTGCGTTVAPLAAGSFATSCGSSCRPAGGIQPGNPERLLSRRHADPHRDGSGVPFGEAAVAAFAAEQGDPLLSWRARHPETRRQPVPPAGIDGDPSRTGVDVQGRMAERAGQFDGGLAAVRQLVQARVLLCVARVERGKVPKDVDDRQRHSVRHGRLISDQRVEDYFRNHFKGSVSIFGSDFIGPGLTS